MSEYTRQMATMLSSAFEGVAALVMVDPDGRITAWSDTAQMLLGWSREEAIGQTTADLIIPERYRNLHRVGLKRFVDTHTPKRGYPYAPIHVPVLTRDGVEILCQMTVAPVIISGQLTGFIALFHDASISRRIPFIDELVHRADQDVSIAAPVSIEDFSVASHDKKQSGK